MANLKEKLKNFQDTIKYYFNNQNLLKQALMHSSYANEKHMNKLANNERLEFLGDAVLELVSSEYIYGKNKLMHEGELTKLRASMVCEPTLAMCAKEINLGDYLLLGKGEDATGGRYRNSILSDALEATIGAIYLDGGFTNAKEFINHFILDDMDNKKLFYDSKTILQEIIQGMSKEVLCYQLVGEEGPDHNKKFTIEAMLGDEKLSVGVGRTKKSAEQQAAYKAILELQANQRDRSL
ncbi:MAG: ribonuclease III [Velocimicrobium sp.]